MVEDLYQDIDIKAIPSTYCLKINCLMPTRCNHARMVGNTLDFMFILPLVHDISINALSFGVLSVLMTYNQFI